MATSNPDLTNYTRTEVRTQEAHGSPTAPVRGRNPFLRCPMPQAATTASDSLNQFYQGGIPQYRIIPPGAPSNRQ